MPAPTATSPTGPDELTRAQVMRRLELAEATRAMVRAASLDLDAPSILARISDTLLATFGLENAWARIFATPDAGEAVWVADAAAFQPPDMNSRLGDPVGKAHELWRRQSVGILYAHGELVGLPAGPDIDVLIDWVQGSGLSSQALVPLGWGDTCIGGLSLARPVGAPRWEPAEVEAAAEIGRDLGQVFRLSQAFAHEQANVRRLEELDVYRSRFVAMVSHELKNPLTAIMANLELLDDAIIGDPTATRAAASVDRAARRMTQLVDDLLVLSRAADPERPVSTDLVDLTDVIRDACDLTETRADQHDLDLRVQIAEDGPLTVVGDASQLDRVVINLVSNALKYTPAGGSVTVGLRRVAEEVELSVRDEGIGISAADQARIFDEFFRSADPHVTAQAGTGLGLAIADQIVRRHGGRMEMESEPGVGSVFRVVLAAAEKRGRS